MEDDPAIVLTEAGGTYRADGIRGNNAKSGENQCNADTQADREIANHFGWHGSAQSISYSPMGG
jgi:hypothetical protein